MAHKQNRSRKHHFVPQLVLRGFSHQGQVRAHDLTNGHSYVTSIADAAAENDYNTVELEDGTRSDVAEKLISTVEAAAAQGLARIAGGGWLNSEAEKVAVARFLTFQYLRVPRQRSSSDLIADTLMKLQMAASGPKGIRDAMTKARGSTPTDEEVLAEWRQLREFDSWKVSNSPTRHVIDSLDMLDRFGPMLHGAYSWCVMRWQSRHLLTSDNPLLLIRARDWPEWSGVGLGTAGRIVFGVTRNCALVLVSKVDGELPDGTELQPSTAGAREICQRLAYASTRRVYHHPDDQLVDLVGPDFELPVPAPHGTEEDPGLELRTALAAANEYAFLHPDEPHPLAGLGRATTLPDDLDD